MIIMLASDICRSIMKQQPVNLLSTLQEWSANKDELVISSITYAELVAGALLTSNQKKHMQWVEAFCDRLDAVVPWGSAEVDAYTQLQLAAMAAGRSQNMNDAMIAAHAISLEARLLCQNGSSFREIDGLDLQVWNLNE